MDLGAGKRLGESLDDLVGPVGRVDEVGEIDVVDVTLQVGCRRRGRGGNLRLSLELVDEGNPEPGQIGRRPGTLGGAQQLGGAAHDGVSVDIEMSVCELHHLTG